MLKFLKTKKKTSSNVSKSNKEDEREKERLSWASLDEEDNFEENDIEQ